MTGLRDRLRCDARGRILWRTMRTKDIERICEQADLYGDVSLLRAARAALRKREDAGR